VSSPADPVAFSLLGLEIRWYAIFILAGIAAAVGLVRWLARARGMDPGFPIDAAPWVVVAGIVGARAYYLALRWEIYAANPMQALNIRLGGLTIHGALAFGVVALVICCRRAGYRCFAWSDLVIAGVALAQGIGRWGNWANQEAFGTPTDLPWGVAIDPERRPDRYLSATHFHPTFLYESIFDIAHAILLAWLVVQMPRKRSLREGDVLWTYFVLYGIARFLIERNRTDSLYIGPLPAAYWISFALVGIGCLMLVLRRTVGPGRLADPVAPRADT